MLTQLLLVTILVQISFGEYVTVTKSLNFPSPIEIVDRLQSSLSQTFQNVVVKLTDSADFKNNGWLFDHIGGCHLIDLGGAKNLLQVDNHGVSFNVSSIMMDDLYFDYFNFFIGPGAGSTYYTNGINGELISNCDRYGNCLSQFAYVDENGAAQLIDYKSPVVGLLGNIIAFEGIATQRNPLIEIVASDIIVDNTVSFDNLIRESLMDLGNIGLGGVLNLEKGIFNFHVMPPQLPDVDMTADDIPTWLKYFNIEAGENDIITCGSSILTNQSLVDDLAAVHSHCWKTDGSFGGHYHNDIDEKAVRYHGYYSICDLVSQVTWE